MDSEVTVPIIFLIVIILGGLAIIIFALDKKPKQNPNKSSYDNPNTEFPSGTDFYISNYLQKPIRIEVIDDGGNNIPLTNRIQPQAKKGFQMKTIEKYIQKGNHMRVYILDDYPGETIYSDYAFEMPEGTTIKMLHIGMITSRWVGADGDYNIGKPGFNAVQGLPWIKIHNLTDRTLSLNNNIDISPGGTLRYSGRDHFGVRLGTVFKDQNNVFPDFIFTIPATDIYYGVVSDIQQSLFGGFQLTPDFDDAANEPQYLLENGWMGGPAYGHIPIGLLPIEGHSVPPQNRWGENVSAENLIHPVGPPLENVSGL
uniref:Uncharacterized protein n=1 Tax=Marseillevirus LCMAC102 TaxID=2506603 RepID=A0A481YSZ5_9VIRU|nr:MAG: hypothetical protein LCMAC102_01430 [Marseillevirus LCMAC102]